MRYILSKINGYFMGNIEENFGIYLAKTMGYNIQKNSLYSGKYRIDWAKSLG